MIIERGKLDIPDPLEEESEEQPKRGRTAGLLPPFGTGRRVSVAPSLRKPKNPPAPKPKPEESSKVMKELKKVLGYTKKKTLASLMLTQVDIDAAERLLLALNVEQLKKLVATQQSFYTPIGIYLATYAKKLLVDLKEGKTDGVDRLRNRQYKNAVPSIEHNHIGGPGTTNGDGHGLRIEIVGADGVAQELAKLIQGGNTQEENEVIDTEATELEQ